jgi:hypothetical protein
MRVRVDGADRRDVTGERGVDWCLPGECGRDQREQRGKER